jgi:hypothetical protein
MTEHNSTISATFKKARLDRADIMVVDFMDFLWPDYDQAIPQEYTVLKVADTTTARAYLPQLSNLRIIVIQGWSRSDAEQMWDEAWPPPTGSSSGLCATASVGRSWW